MIKQPDLHTHSSASDGSLAPEALVARAAAAGIEVLALTDHDTVAGIDAASSAAAQHGITLVPGVEVSVTWGGRTIHIVGLGVDRNDPALRDGLQGVADYRLERAREIARRLAAHGIEGALEGASAQANGGLIGRTHFARFLVQAGHASELRDVFKRYLVKGKPGHVAGEWADLARAVAWINGAGGQAVVAHPARYRFTRSKLMRFIGEFKELGGVGIEVVSGSHSRDDMFVYAQYARETGLLASAGSDYHGPGNPWIELGASPPLPDGCTPIWTDWFERPLARAS